MINKCILIGRAGKDPDIHTTESGKTVARFSMATSENYRDDREETGWRTVTEWHHIVVWGVNAESIHKNLKKGDLVYVEGKIATRSYEDKEKVTKYITEIVGFAKALGKKEAASSSKTEAGTPKAETLKSAKAEDTVDIHNEFPPEDLSDMPF